MVSFVLFLSGCYFLEDMAKKNREKIKRFSKGMDKNEVLNTMGYEISREKNTPVRNPYRHLKDKRKANNHSIDIIYYYTKTVREDGIISDEELTPLVFDNNELIEIGCEEMYPLCMTTSSLSN